MSTCPEGLASHNNTGLFGQIHATFVRAAIQVCVDFIPESPLAFAVFDARDLFDNGAGGGGTAPGFTGTICAENNYANIHGVRFSVPFDFGRFDNLAITFSNSQQPGLDIDGDGKTDLVFQRDVNVFVRYSSNNATDVFFLASQIVPVSADFTGDNISDLALYDISYGIWTIKGFFGHPDYPAIGFGGPGFLPVPADYDGDGKADIAVYSNGAWSILRSSDGGNTVAGHGGRHGRRCQRITTATAKRIWRCIPAAHGPLSAARMEETQLSLGAETRQTSLSREIMTEMEKRT